MASLNSDVGWMSSVGAYLFAKAGAILAARQEFITATNLEPTVLILPPSMRDAVEAVQKLDGGKTILYYNMAVIWGDVEEPTLGFGVSQVIAI